MKIEVICVGALKFAALKEMEADYLNRINRFLPINLLALKDPPASGSERSRSALAQRIGNRLREDDFVVALDETGRKFSSREFAGFIQKKMAYHPGRLVFLIGGFEGLPDSLDERLAMKLSFSPMTMPHDLFRVVFLEQLFRALTIIRGITYHR